MVVGVTDLVPALRIRDEGPEPRGCDQIQVQEIEMTAIYSNGIPEDRRFIRETPTANFKFKLQNQNLIGEFKPGQTYYLDLVPAEEAQE